MKLYNSKEYLTEQLKTKNYKEIALENKVSIATIQRKLKEFKLTKPKGKKWDETELGTLKKEYPDNPDAHKLFSNRTSYSIYHKASRLGLKNNMRKRKYNVNENFFKKWTPEMAYVFGFFCSDGNVSSDGSNCSIHIHSKDTPILKEIIVAMDSNHPISRYSNSSYLKIYNKILCKYLIELGCMPKKSIKLQFPCIPHRFLSHFIRGYFDGDGSIHFNKPNTIKISFVGTSAFIRTLQNKLNSVLKLKINPIRKKGVVCTCFYYGENARKLCYWMYRDAGELYLKRKKIRFDNHVSKRNEL